MKVKSVKKMDKGYIKSSLAAFLMLFVMSACFDLDEDLAGDAFGPWIIPSEEIISLNLSSNAIPAINNPVFSEANEISYVSDDRLVIGIRENDIIRAYPHQVMDWHEVVNDTFGDKRIAITYSPLTGTAVSWERRINNVNYSYLASGLIFRNNTIFTDTQTGSHWLQMQFRGVNGDQSGTDTETVQVVETTWETWSAMYPESEVLTTQTGSEFNYNDYVLGENYNNPDNTETFTSVKNSDDRLPMKQRVHGIIQNLPAEESSSVKVYVIDDFNSGVNVIQENLGGSEYVIAGSSDHNFAVAFDRMIDDGILLDFTAIQGNLPNIMQDSEGNTWNIFGYAVDGPREGQRLNPANSYTGYWFAWADMFPGLEIYGQN
jgi:hypothetical protein